MKSSKGSRCIKSIKTILVLLILVLSFGGPEALGKKKKILKKSELLLSTYSDDTHVSNACVGANEMSTTVNSLYHNKNLVSVWKNDFPHYIEIASFLNDKKNLTRTYTMDEIDEAFVLNVQNPSYERSFGGGLGVKSGKRIEVEFLKDALNIIYKEDLIIVEQLAFFKHYEGKGHKAKITETEKQYIVTIYEPDHLMELVYHTKWDFNAFYDKMFRRTNLRFLADQYAMDRYVAQSEEQEDASIFSLLPKAFVYYSNFRFQKSYKEAGEDIHIFKNPEHGTTLTLKTIDRKSPDTNLVLTDEQLKQKLFKRRSLENKNFKDKVQVTQYTRHFDNDKVQYIVDDFHYEDKKRKWPKITDKKLEDKIKDKGEDKTYRKRTYRFEGLAISPGQETYMIIEGQNHILAIEDFVSLSELNFNSTPLKATGDRIMNAVIAYAGHDYSLEKFEQNAQPFDFLMDKDLYREQVAKCNKDIKPTTAGFEPHQYILPTDGWYRKVLRGEIPIEVLSRY